MRRGDFMVALGEDGDGEYAWVATCLVCGGEFLYMTYRPRRVVNRWQDHVHQSDKNVEAIVTCTGHPGEDSDTVLRALGVPEEFLQ